MRQKIRLYAKDLDLLTLKQLPGFRIGTAVRKALYEYVEYGKCERLHINYGSRIPIEIKRDAFDISFDGEKYQNVSKWLESIRPGMRSAAVKTVFRSAIENPVLFAFACDSTIIIKDAELAAAAKRDEEKIAVQTVEKVATSPNNTVLQQVPRTIEDEIHDNESTAPDDKLDSLFSDDWLENY